MFSLPFAIRCSASLLLILLAAVLPARIALADHWTASKVALEGEPGPPGGGSYINFFSGLSLNDAGDVGFAAGLDSVLPSQATVVVRGRGGADAVFEGDAGPPGTNGVLAIIGTPSLNDAGDFVFGAFESDALYRRVWLEQSGGVLRLVAAEYDPVPGLVDTAYSGNVDGIRITNSGDVLLSTRLVVQPAGDASGAFVLGDGSHEIIVVTGQPAPVPGSEPFTFVHSEDIDYSSAGDVVLLAEFDVANGVGLFSQIDGVLASVALNDDPAPLPTSEVLSLSSPTSDPTINSFGQVAFATTLVGPGAPPTYRNGVFLHDGSSLVPIALEGEPVPDLPGRAFGELLAAKVNDLGEVFFFGVTHASGEPARNGVFVRRKGTIETVVFAGDALPGSGGVPVAGAHFRSIATNDLGQVAVMVTLVDGREAIYLFTSAPGQVPGLSGLGLAWLGAMLASTGARLRRIVR